MFRWVLAIRDWRRRQFLAQHSEFEGMPFAAAWARYEAAVREERRTMDPWYAMADGAYRVMMAAIVGQAVLRLFRSRLGPAMAAWASRGFPMFFVSMIVVAVIMMVFERRLRRRIAERLAAERELGRLPACLQCGYDLRGTAGGRCPECGTPVEGPAAAGEERTA
jgi:hypothetical protein